MFQHLISFRSGTLVPWLKTEELIPREESHTKEIVLIVCCLAVFFTAAREIIWNLLLMPLCRLLRVREKYRVPLCESAIQWLFYTPSWIYCAYVAINSEWFIETWRCWDIPFPNQSLSSSVYWLYLIQMGWYLHCLYAHIALDSRKSDFWAMILHHVITLLLLYFSLTLGYFRIGVLVLFSMDVCDIVLHFLKIVRYIESSCRFGGPAWLQTIIYLMLPLTWFAFRIVYFVLFILWCSIYEYVAVLGWRKCQYWIQFNSLLLFLFALQIYWFVLLMKIAFRRFCADGDINDIRENDGNNNDDDDDDVDGDVENIIDRSDSLNAISESMIASTEGLDDDRPPIPLTSVV